MTGSRVRVVALALWGLAGSLLTACLCVLAIVPAHAQSQPLAELAILFVDREQDPLYQTAPGYAGLFRPEHFSPLPAAELAVKDGAAAARARGVKLAIVPKTLLAKEDAASALR